MSHALSDSTSQQILWLPWDFSTVGSILTLGAVLFREPFTAPSVDGWEVKPMVPTMLPESPLHGQKICRSSKFPGIRPPGVGK